MNATRSPLQSLIERVVTQKANLSRAETVFAFNRIFSGTESDIAIGSFLTALAMKGESDDEILGTYEAVREKEKAFGPVSGPSIDICGTGGDALKTFNISTAAAIVTAASGCRVAKHGNRSMSGPCGSADFLEAVGFDLQLPNERLLRSLDKVGLTFLFAPNFHPLMKNISIARRAVGIRTILNIVGPLCNPCINLSAQLIGVSNPSLLTERPTDGHASPTVTVSCSLSDAVKDMVLSTLSSSSPGSPYKVFAFLFSSGQATRVMQLSSFVRRCFVSY